MGAHRIVLAAAAVSILITSALIATLVAFAGQALHQAVHRKLAAAATSIAISGPANTRQATADTATLRAAMRSAFGTAGFAFYRADWSGLLRLPARYATASIPLTQGAALDGISTHAVLASGSWPVPPRPGQPITAALPATAAALLHLSVGDVLLLHDQVSGRPVRVKLTGVFRPRALSGPAAAYWGLNLISASGASTGGGFTTYGPLIVNPAAFGSALPVSEGSWVAQPVTGDIQAGRLARLAAKITAERQSLASSADASLDGLHMTTGLPALLSGIASNLVVARSLLVIGAVLLLLLAAVTLAGVARLLATDREGEFALLTARGGSRWQLTRLSVAEAILLAVVAAAVGGLIGGRLAGFLAHTGPLRAAGLRLPAVSWEVSGAIALTAVFATLITLSPALRTVAPGAARVRRGRQTAIAGLVRSGADLALLGLAALAVWQLHRTLIVAPSASGAIGIDPVLALAPALALIGGTIILLRLLPMAARAADRLASGGNRLVFSLASWEISRHPIRQASVALLVVMAVATGTLALSEHQSWVRSAQDQAAFTAGADVRVDTPSAITPGQAATIGTAPGVRRAMAAAPVPSGGSAEVLAIDPREAADTVLLRGDESKLAAPALFGAITPAGPAPGIALPGHPSGIWITLRLGPASLRLAPAAVIVSVQDSDGNVYQLPAGTLKADGQTHLLTAALAAGRRPVGAAYPLRLTAVTLDYTLLTARASQDGVLSVLGIGASQAGPPSSPARFARGVALGGWTASASSGELDGLQATSDGLTGPSGRPGVTSWQTTAGGAQELSFVPGYGLAAGPTPGAPPSPVYGQLALVESQTSKTPVSAIATRAFLDASNTSVGSTVQVPIAGLMLPVKIVAAVTTFPTVSGGSGALIADLAVIQDTLVSRSVAPVPVTQWWLATATPRDPADLAGRLPAGSALTSSAGLSAALLGDPLSAVPQQALLAIAAAAALLAMAGFGVSIAANTSERRAQSALLFALGVTRRAQASQLCLEEFMLSLPCAVVGLALGAAISRLLVPAITLTANATRPVPPAVTEFAWPMAVPLALAIAIVPVLVAVTTAARRPDPAARLRATESV
jgi:predicted lysophospholipase L1 biosynthesis ABC-type transport system permease subunit